MSELDITGETYLNLFTDFGFKKVFGEVVNKDLLISFVNTLLPEHQQIVDLDYLQTEMLGETEHDRRAIIDISCMTSKGERLLIEVQQARQTYFKERTMFYNDFAVVQQAQKGTWSYKFDPVISIALINFNLTEAHFNETPDVVYQVEYKDQYNHIFTQRKKMIYVIMPKFKKTLDELETLQDRWFFMLNQLHHLKNIPQQLQNKLLLKVFEIANIAKLPDADRVSYQNSLKAVRDFKNILDTAKDEAEAKGKIEGKIEGELNKAIETALKLHTRNMSIADIIDITGLTVDQLAEIGIKN